MRNLRLVVPASFVIAIAFISLLFSAADGARVRAAVHDPDQIEATQGIGIVARDIALGANHACAVLASGRPVCWGYNGNLQLGVSSGVNHSVAITVNGGITQARAIVAGDFHSCALMSDGDVKCWGTGSNGQLGTGRTTGSSVPTDVIGLPVTITALAASANSNCALRATGGIQCWGLGTSGQLANGAQTSSPTPTVATLPTITFASIAANENTFCAVPDEPGLLCWGTAPLPASGSWTRPTSVAMLSNTVVSAVAVGRRHWCVLVGGTVRCWGENALGQLGNGSTSNATTSTVQVVGLAGSVVHVTAGDNHTCARLTSGAVQCWGENNFGQLGDGTQNNARTAVNVISLGGNAVQVRASQANTCVRFANGRTRCWGRNQYGQTGNGETVVQLTPARVTGIDDATGPLANTDSALCALTRTGQVKCWGGNEQGALGDGTLRYRSSAAPVAGIGESVVALEGGSYHFCAGTQAQHAWCWGWNIYNVTGSPSGSTISVPVQASLYAGNALGVGGGYGHTCLLDPARLVHCWGYNFYGQAGAPGLTSFVEPYTQTGLAGPARAIALGYMTSCAIVEPSGEVQCWGNNGSRMLGSTSAATSSVPITIAGITVDAQKLIVSSHETGCVIDAAGVMQCWGSNSGSILSPTGSTISVPVTVSVIGEPVAAVALGSGFMCAASTSKNAYCWGQNDSGQLGNGTTVYTTTPQRITALDGRVIGLAATSRTACASTTDGAVYCWGRGDSGEAGNATAWKTTPQDVRFSPGYTQFSPRILLPVLRNDPPPPPCDAYEPNDDRKTQVYTISMNTSYSARLCIGDKEDNYRFVKPGSGDLVINFLIGAPLQNRMNYYVYPVAQDGSTGGIVSNCELTGQQFPNATISVRCPALAAGRYVLRMYTVPEGFGDPNATYTFSLN